MEAAVWYEPWNYEAQYRRKQVLKEAEDYFLYQHLTNIKNLAECKKARMHTGSSVCLVGFDERDFPGILQHSV